MESTVTKHSISIQGQKTSVSLEEPFWNALKEIAVKRDTSLSELVAKIDAERDFGNLSSALRLFVLGVYQNEIARLSQPRRVGDKMVA
jgi:predicted DNA-binding ribbon-helix-helix protein